MHHKHPDRSPVAAAILRVLAYSDKPITDLELCNGVKTFVPRAQSSEVMYYVSLLAHAERVTILAFEKRLGGRITGVTAMYELRNPLDGLAAL